MKNFSTTNTGSGDVMTSETLLETLKKLKDLEPKEFLLIAPDGYAYKGDAAKIASVLFRYNPIFIEESLKKNNTYE